MANKLDAKPGDTPVETVSSTSDNRIVNNIARHEYRVLSDEEKAQMKALKDISAVFIALVQKLGVSREYSIAITKMEEACMWAVKGLTK